MGKTGSWLSTCWLHVDMSVSDVLQKCSYWLNRSCEFQEHGEKQHYCAFSMGPSMQKSKMFLAFALGEQSRLKISLVQRQLPQLTSFVGLWFLIDDPNDFHPVEPTTVSFSNIRKAADDFNCALHTAAALFPSDHVRRSNRCLLFFFWPLGSLRAPREGCPPRAPEGAAQVQHDEEADDERHRAAEGAGVRGAAGVPDRAGGSAMFRSIFWIRIGLLFVDQQNVHLALVYIYLTHTHPQGGSVCLCVCTCATPAAFRTSYSALPKDQ